MKKLLLFSLGLGMAFSAFSQNLTEQKMDKANHSEVRTDVVIQKQASPFEPTTVQMNYGKSVLLDRVELGISANAYSMLTSLQRCMAYDEASGTILGTFRSDPATYEGALASGSIMAHYSTDGGDSWEHVVTTNPDPDVHALRYPSGVIYNPDGSSDVNDLFQVSAGPAHTGGVWDYTFFGTGQLNGANQNDYYYEWNVADGNDWARSNMTTIPDAVMYHGSDYESAGTNQAINQTIKLYSGTGDAADGLDWEILEPVTPEWLLEDGISLALYNAWGAWSRDGSIGYVWMIGVTTDSDAYGGYQPQVYFTEDGGESWDEIELDMEDHPTLVEYIAPWKDVNGTPMTVKPTMGISTGGSRNFPGVVDFEGKLHIFAPVFGMSTQSAGDPESGYWANPNAPGGHIFDIVLDTEGLKDIYFVDSIRTSNIEADSWGGVDWDHRLQASKSLDEKVVFAIWADNDNSEDQILNNPDLKGWSFNTDLEIASTPVNFTENDLYAGFFFYHYVSELAPLVDGAYQIPVSVSLTPSEYAAGDPAAQTTTSFVKGIEFQQFVGVNEDLQLNTSNFTVGQNSPNPFTGSTTIGLTSNITAPVMVEVSNLMGQTVYTMDAGIINNTMNIEIPAANFESGVYFYTITIGNESISKKMIIE